MVESTIDKIKDITVERQIRKLAGVIDEQNDTISKYGDATTDIQNLKDSDANQTTQINNLKSDVAKNTTATENLNNRVTTVEQDITNTESEITSVKSAITNIQSKDVAQDGILSTHTSQIQGITESLISDVQILDGVTTGEIKVRIDREAATSIDSNSYNLGLPVSAEIIQGTGPSMFKVQITMSSGVKVVSNDFVFTTEAIGNDVYISSFTFKAGSQNGYLSADIGLNNGVTIEANNFLVPTDPNVIANITDLQTRMSEVESVKTDIEVINTEISGVMTDLNTKVNISQGIDNAGKALVIGTDGNVTTGEVSAGGEVWEEVDLSNFPTDWVVGDAVKVQISRRTRLSTAPTSWNSTIDSSKLTYYEGEVYKSDIVQLTLSDLPQETFIPVRLVPATNVIYLDVIANLNSVNYWNDLDVTTRELFTPNSVAFNGSSMAQAKLWAPSRNNNFEGIYKMWRLKK